MNNYDVLLCLSGGKDSCYLAYRLKEEGKKILAFTANSDVLNKTARQNIRTVIRDLDLDHIYWRTNNKEYRELMDNFLQDNTQGMEDVCGKCSYLTQKASAVIAYVFQIKDVYAGFNKYNSGGGKEYQEVNGFRIHNPLHKNYNLKQIEAFLQKRGIVTDPKVTNCIFIEKIIEIHKKRFQENPFKLEIDGLFESGDITVKEKEEFERFGENNIVLSEGDIVLKPTTDIDYLLKISEEYKYNKTTGNLAREVLDKYGYKFWKGYKNGKLFGVGYLSFIPQMGLTLDGYKDQSSGVDKKCSYISGKLITDYALTFSPEIYTAHDERNRLATIMCKKLGYKIVSKIKQKDNTFVVLRKGGNLWEPN